MVSLAGRNEVAIMNSTVTMSNASSALRNRMPVGVAPS